MPALMDWFLSNRDIVLTTVVICIAFTVPLYHSFQKSATTNHSSTSSSSTTSTNTSQTNNNNNNLKSSFNVNNMSSDKKVTFQDPAGSSSSSTHTEAHPSHAGTSDLQRMTLKKGDKSFKKYNEGDDGSIIARKPTHIEEQVMAQVENAEHIVDALPKDDQVVPKVDLFLPEVLKDAMFVGHLVTDLDSVAGAIGAAALYGGKAALASDVNSETRFAVSIF